MSERPVTHQGQSNNWADQEDEGANSGFKRLTREGSSRTEVEGAAGFTMAVVAVQAAVGVVVATVVLFTGRTEVAWSSPYGAATAVVPVVDETIRN